MNKNIIIAGLSLWIIYLLKNKQTQGKTVTLVNNAVLQNDDEDANYQATFYSQKPIQATVLKQQGNRFDVSVNSKTYDDYISGPGVRGIKKEIPHFC